MQEEIGFDLIHSNRSLNFSEYIFKSQSVVNGRYSNANFSYIIYILIHITFYFSPRTMDSADCFQGKIFHHQNPRRTLQAQAMQSLHQQIQVMFELKHAFCTIIFLAIGYILDYQDNLFSRFLRSILRP